MKTRNQKQSKENKSTKGQKQIKEIFDKFSNSKEFMNDEELFGFLGDGLGIASDDPFIGYILVNLMEIAKMQEVTFKQFKGLFDAVKAKSLPELKKKLPELRKEALMDSEYKKMYKRLYELYIGVHTTLDLDVAEQLWLVYLKPKLKFYKEFEEYLAGLEDKQTKKVHKDLWNMMLEFSYDINSIQNDYKQDDGWPLFIDNFVQLIKEKSK